MAGKRVSLASLAGSKVETVPGASRPDLVHVHPDTVAPTPLNPRRAFDDTELTELGEDMRSGQLQPCVAVAKAAYLKLYPEHADQLPDGCRYVMAAGERRWRAALKVGLDSLDLMLRHDLTETRVRFLAAVLSENVQRANFNPIEEADGLRAMLELHDGNQAAAARAMGKSKAWFNQRIGLLRLSDEMVHLVLEGKLTAFRDMRRYAALPPGEQYATWKTDQEQPRPPKADPAPDGEQPKTYTAVYAPPARKTIPPPPEPAAPVVPEKQSADDEQKPALIRQDPASPAPVPHHPSPVQGTPSPDIPSQVADPTPASQRQEPQVKRFPYSDAESAAFYLIDRMPQDQLDKLTDLLVRHRDRQGANAT